MSDFLLDFRPAETRAFHPKASDFLKFLPHIRVQQINRPEFSLIYTSVENPSIWGIFEDASVLVAISGRIVLEEEEWRKLELDQKQGGMASRWIAENYLRTGQKSLEQLNGNFSLMLYDKSIGKIFLVTDPGGAFSLFKSVIPGKPVFSTHPDALAIVLGEEQNWDETSFADFAYSSIVTPPYTYYKNIHSVGNGHILEVSLHGERPIIERSYFKLDYAEETGKSEAELAEELAHVFSRAVQKRSLPMFGPMALALSGGLDSRTILAAIKDRSQVVAFSCINEENFEFKLAKQIAHAAGVKLVPIIRPFDYYADNAELGIKISGGMGSFANNHFLGIADQLRSLEIENLLTGCYCDYLFKGLVINRSTTGLFGREELGPYRDQYYFNHFRIQGAAETEVKHRWEERIPPAIRSRGDAGGVFEIEKARTFPLWHEGDNAQRLVPQRVLHNYLPLADRDLLEIYRRIPYRYKLNRSIFKIAAQRICGPSLSRIPDANTGAPITASLSQEAISYSFLRAKRKIRKMVPKISSDSSWPNWQFYVSHSAKLRELWRKPVPAANDLFRRIIPPEDVRNNPSDYRGREVFRFVSLLTLKIWLDQRCSKE